jgi:hypothetical protein
MSRQLKEVPARSYLSTAPFYSNFFTYTTSMSPSTFKKSGDLSAVSGATSSNCPAGRVLRENGRKLYPGAHDISTVNGVATTFPSGTVMVGVFDNQSGLNGFIDPNAPMFAVYNGDRAGYLKDAVDPVGALTDQGAPVKTNGSANVTGDVTVGGRLILNSGNTGSVALTGAPVVGLYRKATVNAANCKSTSVIMLTYAGQNNPGILSAEAIADGSFQVVSSSVTDAGVVRYLIVN